MKKLVFCGIILCTLSLARGQNFIAQADSMKDQGLLVPALEKYGLAYMQNPSAEHVDRRRAEIGLGPLHIYLKERFDIDWMVEQK